MLRLLHTADWHLGQSFHGFDRDFEHAAFFRWLADVLHARAIDVLLVAGDVFDGVNPSAEAQRRFYEFLARSHRTLPHLQTVIIAGNHDAASRLEAPSELLASLRISTIGTVARDEAGELDCSKFLVPLQSRSGEVEALAVAVPFLRLSDVPSTSDPADLYLGGVSETYRRSATAALDHCRAKHPDVPLIALGHCHVQGGEESRDSERRIIIGGAEALKVETFGPEYVYVALGHLHRAQALDGGRVRYCGSPLPLSFSETSYQHQVLEVTIQERRLHSVESLPVPRAVPLLRIPARDAAPLSELLPHLAELPETSDEAVKVRPFLEVRVLDDGPDPTRRRTIEQALASKAVRLASIRLQTPEQSDPQDTPAAARPRDLADLAHLDPEEIMRAAHRERFQDEPASELLEAMREILAAEAANSSSAS